VGESNEKSISLIPNHTSVVLLTNLLHDLAVLPEEGGELIAQLLQEAG
jgi:hypothetical protein